MWRKIIIGLAFCGMSSVSLSQQSITIGVPQIQSGPLAAYGAYFNNGVAAAADAVNQRGGVKVDGKHYELKIATCDTQADSSAAAACGRKLLAQNELSTMAMATSIETYPILGFNESKTEPFLVITSTASGKLTELGNKLAARYWFNTYTFMPELTKRFAEYFKNKGEPLPRIAIIASENEFGKAWRDNFEHGWEEAGGEILSVATFTLGTTDFFPQLSALMKFKPDIIAEPDTCDVIPPVLKQARQLGFKGPFIIDQSCDPEELTAFLDPDVFAGSYFVSNNWTIDTPAKRQFLELYKNITDQKPTAISADGYGQINWIVRAMEYANNYEDPYVIRSALGKVLDEDWNLLGIKDLRDDGDTSAEVFMRKVNTLTDIEIIK